MAAQDCLTQHYLPVAILRVRVQGFRLFYADNTGINATKHHFEGVGKTFDVASRIIQVRRDVSGCSEHHQADFFEP